MMIAHFYPLLKRIWWKSCYFWICADHSQFALASCKQIEIYVPILKQTLVDVAVCAGFQGQLWQGFKWNYYKLNSLQWDRSKSPNFLAALRNLISREIKRKNWMSWDISKQNELLRSNARSSSFMSHRTRTFFDECKADGCLKLL